MEPIMSIIEDNGAIHTFIHKADGGLDVEICINEQTTLAKYNSYEAKRLQNFLNSN